MADTCGECESWKMNFELSQGKVGQCSRNLAYTSTWEDCTCPAFRRKADAAERAARRIREEAERMPGYAAPEWYALITKFIREEIAKDKEAR